MSFFNVTLLGRWESTTLERITGAARRVGGFSAHAFKLCVRPWYIRRTSNPLRARSGLMPLTVW
jgi:hypothetical protein